MKINHNQIKRTIKHKIQSSTITEIDCFKGQVTVDAFLLSSRKRRKFARVKAITFLVEDENKIKLDKPILGSNFCCKANISIKYRQEGIIASVIPSKRSRKMNINILHNASSIHPEEELIMENCKKNPSRNKLNLFLPW